MASLPKGTLPPRSMASVSRKTNSYNSVYPHLITRQYEINSGGENLGSFLPSSLWIIFGRGTGCAFATFSWRERMRTIQEWPGVIGNTWKEWAD